MGGGRQGRGASGAGRAAARADFSNGLRGGGAPGSGPRPRRPPPPPLLGVDVEADLGNSDPSRPLDRRQWRLSGEGAAPGVGSAEPVPSAAVTPLRPGTRGAGIDSSAIGR